MKNENSKNKKKSNSLLGLGLLTAVSASLCCITPVLLLFAGASGMASTFSWIEPFRPYLIWITILVLAFAWYLKLKPNKQKIDCECDPNKKLSFWQSKMFLGIVTVFAAVMLAFPHYSYIFYPAKKTNIVQNIKSNRQELNLQVKGMTCESCNLNVENTLGKLPGYINAKADYKTGTVKVEFDNSKSSEKDVIDAVNSTGYKVVGSKKAINIPTGYKSLSLNVKGLTCESCDLNVENKVAKLPGYINAKADYKTGIVKVEFDTSKSSEKDVKDAINSAGYKVVSKNN